MTDKQPESDWNFEQLFPKDIGRMGEYLKRTGRPLCARLDIRLTSMEELRWACVLISELNQSLNQLAFEDERDEVLRVMLARHALDTARISLKYRKQKVTKNAAPKPGAGRKSTTTRSVSPPIRVGDLDRAWKRPVLPRRNDGETE
jgi:hypothetical protein